MAEILPINKLLEMDLEIPNYQRPYKWTRKNVADLLDDIDTAISEYNIHGKEYRYRIGTVILFQNHKGKWEIVDGQQRLVTLSLIQYAMGEDSCTLLTQHFGDTISQNNIKENYALINERLSMSRTQSEKETFQAKLKEAFTTVLEAVVLKVNRIEEAFQLFDSQNTRGRELDPHDLLKAYHLREMNGARFEKLRTIEQWENIPPADIRELFSLYLYPILNWSRGEKSTAFTASEIDNYKGVGQNCTYTYAQRVCKAMPYFQLNQPFVAGGDFFRMVTHYIYLLNDIKQEIAHAKDFEQIQAIICDNTVRTRNNEERYTSTGFRYAMNLFYCAVLFYYDRFHSLDAVAIKKLFLWAMMLRVDMQNLGLESVNNYAIGDNNGSYTNHIAMFWEIANARSHKDIANLQLSNRKSDEAAASKWNSLYTELKKLGGN